MPACACSFNPLIVGAYSVTSWNTRLAHRVEEYRFNPLIVGAYSVTSRRLMVDDPKQAVVFQSPDCRGVFRHC